MYFECNRERNVFEMASRQQIITLPQSGGFVDDFRESNSQKEESSRKTKSIVWWLGGNYYEGQSENNYY